jgi:type IX secretion system PorP/SprF family membrane protein
MKKLCLAICLCLVSVMLVAQQDPIYSLYLNNPFVLNPAYAGLQNNLSTSASFRQQWAGLAGSPTTINANGHMSLFKNTMGTGLLLTSDQTGSTDVTEVFGAYSYRIRINSSNTLAFGIQGGMQNFNISTSGVKPQHTNDPFFENAIRQTKPMLGAGVILTSDKYFFSFSVPRMLKNNLESAGLQGELYNQHFYLLGSYVFMLQERIRLKPSVLLRMVNNAPVTYDVNAALIFFENYQAGVLTRNFNTYGLFFQLLIRDFLRVGYVFEVPTGNSVGAQFTSHELTAGVRFNVLRFHSNMSVFSY